MRRRTFLRQGGIRRRLRGPPLRRRPHRALRCRTRRKALTAQARTEPLMRRAPRGNEQLVAARTGTRRFFRSVGWALTLALRLGGFLGCGLLRLPPLADPLPIAATLLTAALPATLRLPPGLVGTPTPPTVRRILTRRTAIPRLGILGLERTAHSLSKDNAAAAVPDWSLALKKIVDHYELDPRERQLPKGQVPERTSIPLRDTLYPLPYPSASLSLRLTALPPGRHCAGRPPFWSAKSLNPRPPLTYDTIRNLSPASAASAARDIARPPIKDTLNAFGVRLFKA